MYSPTRSESMAELKGGVDTMLAAESRNSYAMPGTAEAASSTNYNMQGYRNLMAGQNKFGQSSRNNNNNNFNQRVGNNNNSNNGGGVGVGSTGTTGMAYYDYGDTGLVNRRMGGGGGGSGAGYGNLAMNSYGGYGGAATAMNRGYSGGGSGGGYSGGSGGGGYSPINYLDGYASVCEDKGLNPGLVLATLAGAAVAFAILYRQVTLGRSLKAGPPSGAEIFDKLSSIVWAGLEEFEEKVDRIAENQNNDENSWISSLYNQFVGQYGDVDNQLTEQDMDGAEPPLLDETWGLGLRTKYNGTGNTHVEDPVSLASEKKKRAVKDEDVRVEAEDARVEDEDDARVEAEDEEKCRVDMWRCLSNVIEGGLHYMDQPDGLMGLAKKTMFKVAFHGGFSNVWSGVMSIPEARKIKKCMTAHQECISYEVIRREAMVSLDPTDPEYEQYTNLQKEPKSESSSKRKRLIVNPEFVESLDQSDGSVEYDNDVDV